MQSKSKIQRTKQTHHANSKKETKRNRVGVDKIEEKTKKHTN